jgi:hypothetical protein
MFRLFDLNGQSTQSGDGGRLSNAKHDKKLVTITLYKFEKFFVLIYLKDSVCTLILMSVVVVVGHVQGEQTTSADDLSPSKK